MAPSPIWSAVIQIALLIQRIIVLPISINLNTNSFEFQRPPSKPIGNPFFKLSLFKFGFYLFICFFIRILYVLLLQLFAPSYFPHKFPAQSLMFYTSGLVLLLLACVSTWTLDKRAKELKFALNSLLRFSKLSILKHSFLFRQDKESLLIILLAIGFTGFPSLCGLIPLNSGNDPVSHVLKPWLLLIMRMEFAKAICLLFSVFVVGLGAILCLQVLTFCIVIIMEFQKQTKFAIQIGTWDKKAFRPKMMIHRQLNIIRCEIYNAFIGYSPCAVFVGITLVISLMFIAIRQLFPFLLAMLNATVLVTLECILCVMIPVMGKMDEYSGSFGRIWKARLYSRIERKMLRSCRHCLSFPVGIFGHFSRFSSLEIQHIILQQVANLLVNV